MQALRQMGGGIIIALVSIVFVIGGISLALAESASPLETQTQLPPTQPLSFSTPSLSGLSTPTITQPETATATLMPSITSVPPTLCASPSGWFQIIVGANDTIYTLAQRYNTSEDALKNANCLNSYALQPGNILFVPPVPTVYVVPCSPPIGWVKTHVVQAGDNLYRIALSYGLTYPQLQNGNCMGSSIAIYTGQLLWVPNIPTLSPMPGVTVIPNFPTSTPSFTPAPPTYTLTPWPTATFLPTASPAPTAISSPTGTQTAAPTATIFYTPSLTPFPSP